MVLVLGLLGIALPKIKKILALKPRSKLVRRR
jgi:hypothetical protein